MTKPVKIAAIRRDGGTQARVGNHEETIEQYAELMRDGRWEWTESNLVTLFRDDEGVYWLADGFHRVEAAQRAEWIDILAEVRPGSRRDAVLYAAGANAQHGLRRTRADVRRAIEVLLRDEEWGKWSDREIARRVICDNKTVAAVRASLSEEIPQIAERTVSRNGTTYSQAAPQRTVPEVESLPVDEVLGVVSRKMLALRGWEVTGNIKRVEEGGETIRLYEVLAPATGSSQRNVLWKSREGITAICQTPVESWHEQALADDARHTACHKRGIVPPLPDDQIPEDWDIWRSRADAAGCNLSIQTNIIDLRVGVGTDNILIRAGLTFWADVQAKICEQEQQRISERTEKAKPLRCAVCGWGQPRVLYTNRCECCYHIHLAEQQESQDTLWHLQQALKIAARMPDDLRRAKEQQIRDLIDACDIDQPAPACFDCGTTEDVISVPGAAKYLCRSCATRRNPEIVTKHDQPAPAPAIDVPAPPIPPMPRTVLMSHIDSVLADLIQRLNPREVRLLSCLFDWEASDMGRDMSAITDGVWTMSRECLADRGDDHLTWVMG